MRLTERGRWVIRLTILALTCAAALTALNATEVIPGVG